MTGDFLTVAAAVLRRNLIHAFKNPALLVPSIVFPLLFLVAFAGGLSNVANVPGFDFPSGYTAFQFVFVFLQAAAFGGVFTGFATAADFESGFGRRLLLGAPRREGILAGYALAAMARFLLTGTVVTVAALLSGMQVDGNPAQLVGLLSLALLVNLTATLWGTGMALRFQTLQAGPAMQIPVFLILFTAPVFVPLTLLKGWISAVAPLNPITRLLETGRGFISGEPTVVLGAFALALGLAAFFCVWAVRGMRSAERSA
jgi:ABC-2 type transport system permease protein